MQGTVGLACVFSEMAETSAGKNWISGGDLNDWRLELSGGLFIHMSGTSFGRDQRLGSARTVDQVIYTWPFPGN